MEVLVPYDGSPQAEGALDHALETFPDASVVALYVIDPVEQLRTHGGLPEPLEESRREAFDWEDHLGEHVEDVLAEATERAGDADREIRTAVETGEVARTIVEFAEEEDVDAIVVGSHARDLASRIVLGSTADTVARQSPVPVTVVR